MNCTAATPTYRYKVNVDELYSCYPMELTDTKSMLMNCTAAILWNFFLPVALCSRYTLVLDTSTNTVSVLPSV